MSFQGRETVKLQSYSDILHLYATEEEKHKKTSVNEAFKNFTSLVFVSCGKKSNKASRNQRGERTAKIKCVGVHKFFL